MSERSATVVPRWLIAVGVLVAAGIAIAVWRWPSPSEPKTSFPTSPDFPVPAFTETPYLNVGPEAHYIGIDACAECHRDNHKSYLMTAHSRALAKVDVQGEPPDAAFHHQASGRDYRVYRRDGQLRHEEVLRTSGGSEIARLDLPAKYVMGSGSFGRSYLVEADGFLQESPISWYSSKKKWDLSPGYNQAAHWSFERPIRIGCLNCHAGRVQPADGSTHKMLIHEQAIGCERCHGPGSLHAEQHRTHQLAPGQADFSIVNPTKLSRPLLESICADCHLNGPAVVAHRGRGPTDFRPGRPLTDYRTDYRFDSGNEQMTVVGHIEQLRRSKCYQNADSLTCITCHDPHATERPKNPVEFYRQKCLNCHADKGCSLDRSERRKQSPADNCVACHMPRGDTDIPHIAFTHHRIGIHRTRTPAAPDRVPALVPTDDDSQLSPADRERNLGLAYVVAASNAEYARYANAFRAHALSLLEGVSAAGLNDGATDQALAELLSKSDGERARRYARDALDTPDLQPEPRALALMLLASTEFDEHDYKAAITRLEELVRLRRFSEDWRVLGVSYLLDGRVQSAIRALEKSLAMRPFQPATCRALGEAYSRFGDPRRAREYQDKAKLLESLHQQ